MSHLKSFATLGAAAAAFVALSASANAGVITQTLSYSSALVSWSSSQSQVYNLFNTPLSTLTSVVISTSAQGATTGTIQNTAGTAGQLSANVLPLGLSLVSGIPAVNTAAGSVFALSGFAASPNFPGVLPGNSVVVNFNNLLTGTTTLTTGLSAFIGAGTDTITANVSGSTNAGNSAGNFNANIVTNDSATVTITYNYTTSPPVGTPEPASMALLGMGLVGLGAAARRKRRV